VQTVPARQGWNVVARLSEARRKAAQFIKLYDEKRKLQYDQRREAGQFDAGDRVLLKYAIYRPGPKKLQTPYSFRTVVRMVSPVRVLVRDDHGVFDTVHVRRLTMVKSGDGGTRPSVGPASNTDRSEDKAEREEKEAVFKTPSPRKNSVVAGGATDVPKPKRKPAAAPKRKHTKQKVSSGGSRSGISKPAQPKVREKGTRTILKSKLSEQDGAFFLVSDPSGGRPTWMPKGRLPKALVREYERMERARRASP